MGQLGIHHDSLVTGNILSNSLTKSQLKIATGYFNLTNEYMSTIVDHCLANCSILMAHPNVKSKNLRFLLLLKECKIIISFCGNRQTGFKVLKDRPVVYRLPIH